MEAAVRLRSGVERGHGLHGQPLLTQIENHSSGYAIEAGEYRTPWYST